MPQLNLDFEKTDTKPNEFIVFFDNDINVIESLKLPNIIKFQRADKFDSKFIQSSSDLWSFNYSGKKIQLNFSHFSKFEKKLAKFFLANYIQVNTPSSLDAKLQAFSYAIVLPKLLHV
ncbi:hypothetical protein [Acinetobacter higginsii]|nr:hypothetical protein [Acinetobacter higginsii]